MELGSGEIVMILIVALLIYGGRLPEVARSIGKSFGELKRGFTETKDVVAAELNADLDLNDGLDESRREVQRVTAAAQAPPELAKEDISASGISADAVAILDLEDELGTRGPAAANTTHHAKDSRPDA